MLKQEVVDAIKKHLPYSIDRMLEIGTGWGESAKFLSELRPECILYTIDAFGLYGDGRIYKSFDHAKVLEINKALNFNVVQILGDSHNIPWEHDIDLLFIDGDHTFKGCMEDFQRYGTWVNAGGIIIFDDYHQENNPDNGVKEVVAMILATQVRYELVYEGHYCAILRVNYKKHIHELDNN